MAATAVATLYLYHCCTGARARTEVKIECKFNSFNSLFSFGLTRAIHAIALTDLAELEASSRLELEFGVAGFARIEIGQTLVQFMFENNSRYSAGDECSRCRQC